MVSSLPFITRVPPRRPESSVTAPVVLSLSSEAARPEHHEVAELAPLPSPMTVLGPRTPMVRLGRLASGVGALVIETGAHVTGPDVAWETVDLRAGLVADAPLDPSRRPVVSVSKEATAVVMGLRWVRNVRRVLVALHADRGPVSVNATLLSAPLRVDAAVRVIEMYLDGGEVVLRANLNDAASWSDYDIAL